MTRVRGPANAAIVALSPNAETRWRVIAKPWARGANGSIRVTRVENVANAPYTVLGWDVRDIRSTALALGERGLTFARYPGMEQDELGIWTAPGGSQIAWFRDPDGNVLSIAQHPRAQ